MRTRLDGWLPDADGEFDGEVVVQLDGTERPWLEGSETSATVVLGVDVKEPYSDKTVQLVFPTIEACRDWLRAVAHELTLEAWVQAAPR
jgi:hypothetical protein